MKRSRTGYHWGFLLAALTSAFAANAWGLDRVRKFGSKSGKPMGRPRVIVDWEKIQKTMEQFRVPEKVAARICGYNESTFYKAKRDRVVKND